VARREIRTKTLRALAAKPVAEMVATDMSTVAEALAETDLSEEAEAIDDKDDDPSEPSPTEVSEMMMDRHKPARLPKRFRRKMAANEAANEAANDAANDADAPEESDVFGRNMLGPDSDWRLQTDMSVDDAASRSVLHYNSLPRTGYVRLADLLPATPSRGAFDVAEIKRSLYFFS